MTSRLLKESADRLTNRRLAGPLHRHALESEGLSTLERPRAVRLTRRKGGRASGSQSASPLSLSKVDYLLRFIIVIIVAVLLLCPVSEIIEKRGDQPSLLLFKLTKRRKEAAESD